MIENLFIKFLQKFCFDLLELNINMNIFDLFKKIFTISMFLSLLLYMEYIINFIKIILSEVIILNIKIIFLCYF